MADTSSGMPPIRPIWRAMRRAALAFRPRGRCPCKERRPALGGAGGDARLNWEEKFARGGIGAIISSYTPVAVRGRILTRYAMIDHDDKIAFWREVGKRVHDYDCRFIMQLSHSGRQQDLGGVENLY